MDARCNFLLGCAAPTQPSSLLDLKEVGYKSVWLVYISPLSAHKGQ
jgi:hypothetical protein